jgi:hypothetical protein
MPEMYPVKHADRQVQRAAGQSRQLNPGKLEHPAHWATRGAAS